MIKDKKSFLISLEHDRPINSGKVLTINFMSGSFASLSADRSGLDQKNKKIFHISESITARYIFNTVSNMERSSTLKQQHAQNTSLACQEIEPGFL